MFYNGYFIRCFYKYLFYISIIIKLLLVYCMLINVNGMYYGHVCEQVR